METSLVAQAGTSSRGGLAARYATALYNLASEHGEIDLVVDQMNALGRLIDESADLRRLLASPLFDIQQTQHAMRAVLEEQGFGKIVIVKRVDPGLLGGLVVRIGARLYDSSLKSRLQRLQYAMKGAA